MSKEKLMNSLRKFAGLVVFAAFVLFALTLSGQTASAKQANAQQANAQQDALQPQDTGYYFSFDSNLDPWTPVYQGRTKLPGLQLSRIDKENGCVEPTGHLGGGYANLSMFNNIPSTAKSTTDRGYPLPVATWMMAYFSATGVNTVSVDYAARSVKGCEDCSTIAYVGATPPVTSDFAYADDGRLSPKWQNFSHKQTVTTQGKVYVAIGFNNTNASMGLDCVSIKIQPVVSPLIDGGAK